MEASDTLVYWTAVVSLKRCVCAVKIEKKILSRLTKICKGVKSMYTTMYLICIS